MIQFFLASPEAEYLGQLILALVLGALVGVERELAKKTAGMRTYALVSLGSALFSIISIHALEFNSGISAINFDPTRIAAQIVVGVGFIGGGLIIFDRTKITGVTTAAGLWIAAAIGMAVGFRFYYLSVAASALAIFIFIILWSFEEKVIKKSRLSNNTNENEQPD